jgi:hypothetical protein
VGAKGLKAQYFLFFTDATRWAWDCL